MGKLILTYSSLPNQTITQGIFEPCNISKKKKKSAQTHPFSATGRCIFTSREITKKKEEDVRNRHSNPEEKERGSLGSWSQERYQDGTE